MIIETIWTGNRARNFNYLIVCEPTGEALAIDPCDPEKVLNRAAQNDWTITQVVNTHEHQDHIGGNQRVVEQTQARLLAAETARSLIKGVDVGLQDGDVIEVGRTVRLRVLETPGHTMCHISLLSETNPPHLFCGDTVFNAGVGNCRFGGDPVTLYQTLSNRIGALSDETRIYPGHDYLSNNLRFTLDREPDNQRASQLLEKIGPAYDPEQPLISTLGLEREINTFMRLKSASLVARLRESFADLPSDPGDQQVFLYLRQLRDAW